MDVPRANSDSPLPVPGSEVFGPGSSQTARPEQPQPTTSCVPAPAEQVQAFLSRVQPPPEAGEPSPHANPVTMPLRPLLSKRKQLAYALRNVNALPEAGSNARSFLRKVGSKLPVYRNRNVTPTKPQLGINDLPNEILQNILSKAVPDGTRNDKVRAMCDMARVNKTFKAQVKERLLPELNRLVALRVDYLITHPRSRNQSDFSYARKLKKLDSSLTPEQACFVAYGFTDSGEEDKLSNSVEFQPAEVQNMITLLREQFPPEKDEPTPSDYAVRLNCAVRLKRERPDLTPEHASMAMLGYAEPLAIKDLLHYIEFQPFEVQDKVADLLARCPRDVQDWGELQYAVRLMRTDPMPRPEHAALAATENDKQNYGTIWSACQHVAEQRRQAAMPRRHKAPRTVANFQLGRYP